MAPAPSPVPPKAPPTGPRALRTPNGVLTPSHGSIANGSRDKVSISLPTLAHAPVSLNGPKSNGFSMALPAESSRQAQEARRPPPPLQEPPPPPRSPSPRPRRPSRSPQRGLDGHHRLDEEGVRSKISISFTLPNGKPRPVPPHQSDPRTSRSPTAQFFPGADPPISPKGERRLETVPLQSVRLRETRPPSSPKGRPGLLGRRPATPPPPPDSAPPPPPSPERRLLSPPPAPSSGRRPGISVLRGTPPPPSETAPPSPPPPPPPPTSHPPTPPTLTPSSRATTPPPIKKRPPSPPREPPSVAPQIRTATPVNDRPPAFHFRELPGRSPPAPPSFHFRELPQRVVADEAEPQSPPSRKSPPPSLSWKIEDYVSPASASRRINSGSYYVVGGPSKLRPGKSGEAKKNPAAYTRYDGVERDGTTVEPKDPRLKSNAWKRGIGTAANVSKFYHFTYQWDEATSVGPKPPAPPTAVLITGLSPLTTADQIRKFLAPHGRLQDLDVKMDKKSGSQLGICWVKFAGPHHGRGGSAHEVAKTVCRVCDGQRISLMGDERIRVVLDGRGLRAETAVKEEMERKYAPKPKPIPKIATPVSAGAQTPHLPTRPAPPRPTPVPFHRNGPPRPWQPRSYLPPRPLATQQLSSSFTDRPFVARNNRFERDTYRRRDSSESSYSSRSRSHGRRSDYSSDSENERRRSPLKLQRHPERDKYDEDAEKILKENGHPALFIDIQCLPTTSNNEGPLHDHFKHFKPSRSQGWYILFTDDTAAGHAKGMLDNTRINGRKITMSLKDHSNKASAIISTSGDKMWRFLSFGKKNKAPPLVKPPRRPIRIPSEESDEVPAAALVESPTIVPEPEPETELGKPGQEEPRKRKAKPVLKAAKKARVETVGLAPDVEPEVVEIKLEVERTPATLQPALEAKPKKKPQAPLNKLIVEGVFEDEEDAYWLGQVLAADSVDEQEVELLPDTHPLYHVSGSWRAEGFKRIPKTQKSRYLPQRNRAQASAEEAGALTTGRAARVTGRRLVQDMTHHKSSTAESDLFAFNQLRIRKKQLKFARSAIEGYGLYAQETIQPGEMVCEYVGELVRSSVADLREHQYLKQGIGSSYLFRIDGDVVCDATFRGSVSRLINHSCDPSATAKIISINGQSKIVIYAKRMLHPGEEILYDYKFPLESDPALRVPCLCGAATCRGWLN